MANYLLQAQQKWAVTAVTNVSGFLGSPSFKITIAGTDRALAATAEGELVASAFTGAPEQLRRLDSTGRWHLARHAQVHPEFQRSHGLDGDWRKFPDTRQIHSGQQKPTLAVQDAVKAD